ncbi:hypothetical protein B7P43_G09813 [Cryptotermes secundus]|nr:hypothetical protein B7P43_G09813 [Cryptotermes secundus]
MSVSNLKNDNVAFSKLDQEAADLLDEQYGSGSKAEEPLKMRTESLCRVCACPSEELVPVFGQKGSELQLLEKIHIHLPIMVTPEDILPVTMCTSCICKLEMCHQFVHGCLDADIKLRTIFGLEMDELMLYSDEHTVESPCGTSKEPSPQTEKEELYSHTSEGSADDEYETHTAQSVKSDESVDNFDYTEHPEISAVVPEQNTEVGVRDVDDIEYKAVDASHHSLEQLNHTAYIDGALVEEQNVVIDMEGADVVEYETYSLGHSADEVDCAEYAEISWTHGDYTEVDADVINEVQYDANDFDEHSDQLQSSEEQEITFDQQSHEYLKNAESAAGCMKLRHSSAAEKSKMKRENPKVKVVIVNVKDTVNKTHTAQFRRTSDLMMMKDLSSNKIQQALEYQESDNSKSPRSDIMLKSSAVSIGDMTPKQVKLERPARMHGDHSYTYRRHSFYPCIYCRETVNTKERLIAHQVTEHPGKVFCCEQCGSVYYSKALLDEHQKSHVIETEDGSAQPESNIFLQSSVCVKEIQPLYSNNDKVVDNGVMNLDSREKLGTLKLENGAGDILPVPEVSEAEKDSVDKDIQRQNEQENTEEIRMVDVHIKPEKGTEKGDVYKNTSKFCLKLSKEFENIDLDYKSKILETVNKIMEENGSHTKIDTVIPEIVRQEAEKKLGIPESAKPVLKTQMRDMKHNIWKCNLCNHVSTSLQKHQEHRRTHPQIKFSCSYCNKQFPSQKSRSHHVSIRHPDKKRFICEHCGKSFRFWLSLRDHLFTHNKGECIFQCEKCGKEFESKASYDSHDCKPGGASYLCDICGKSMRYLTSLRSHRLSHADPASQAKHSCAICGKEYSSRCLLADHMRLHTDEHPHQCIHCGKAFQTRSQLSNHKLIHINARKHKCPLCGKGFARRQHMRVHVRAHQRSLKYACKICNCPFSSVGELIMHRKTHTQEEIAEASKKQVLQGGGPLAFTCQICGRHLASKFTLKNHVMMHADDKPFHCEICGKKFTMKSSLQTHHRVHTRERPHTCQHCGDTFQSRQNLVVHERIHTGETPFKCTECDKAYRSRHSLRQHLMIHADYRPYECLQCGKRFRRQDILITHIRTHTGERPFACNVCGRAFKQKGDCNKHQQRHAL